MRSLLLAFALVACASEPPPQPVAPAHPTPAPDPAVAQASAQLAALQAAEQRARDEQQRQMTELQQRATTQHEAIAAKQKADAEAHKKACDDSRSQRVTAIKFAAAERLKAEARVLNFSKAIRAACKLGTKPTGAVRVTPSGGGWRVAPELQETVSCSSLPKGATKDDAYVILWRLQNEGSVDARGRILEPEDITPEDRACEQFDKAAGLDLDAVTYENGGALEMLKRF